MKFLFFKSPNKGFGLIEAVLGPAIILFVFLGLAVGLTSALRSNENTLKTLQASFLLEETIEVVKHLRDISWINNIATLSSDTDYFLSFSGGVFSANSNNVFIDSFERKFIIENVLRNPSGEISDTGADDPGTKKVTATVSWAGQNGTTTKSISTYITNIWDN